MNTFCQGMPTTSKESTENELAKTPTLNNEIKDNETGVFNKQDNEKIENEKLLQALRTHYKQKIDGRATA